jgi:RES domain
MSSSIWTRCGRRTERLRSGPWRAVEAQHLISTRKLVDSDAEHEVLEALVDASKPALPPGKRPGGLHYLLATPFRYPPLPHGSRFGGRSERGIWYGAEEIETTLAEAAYYRLLFVEGTAARLVPVAFHWSLFQATVDAQPGADLTSPPFSRYRDQISSRTEYAASQRLGAEMRRDGVLACRYTSARDPKGGACVAVFSPEAFARRAPSRDQKWFCTVTASAVEFTRGDLLERRTVEFAREVFLVDGRLPAPATS